jgi:hypothetical protein
LGRIVEKMVGEVDGEDSWIGWLDRRNVIITENVMVIVNIYEYFLNYISMNVNKRTFCCSTV